MSPQEYISICQRYRAIFDTPKVKEKWGGMERGVVIIKCSLPYSSKCQMLGVLNVFSLSLSLLSLSPFLSLHCDQSQALKNPEPSMFCWPLITMSNLICCRGYGTRGDWKRYQLTGEVGRSVQYLCSWFSVDTYLHQIKSFRNKKSIY